MMLRENDIRYISSSVALDPGPYNLQDAVPFHIPQTAMVTDLLFDDPFYKGTINDKALAKIKWSQQMCPQIPIPHLLYKK